LAVCIWSGSAAEPLAVALEGILGMPIGPGPDYWDYNTPTSLLGREHFVVSVSGRASDLMSRQYASGRADRGFALGVSGGGVASWDYGVTGLWALGSGQARTWAAGSGAYELSPSPKVGVMAMSHAMERGALSGGFTVHRASFSVADALTINEFPRSATNGLANRYLYDLLPRAIGNEVGYDALGSRLELLGEIRYASPLGRIAFVASWAKGAADWLTHHESLVPLIAGPKNGSGQADWRSWSFEGRWGVDVAPTLAAEVNAGRGYQSGEAFTWLRNPARVVIDDGKDIQEIEPRTWGHVNLDGRSHSAGLNVRWLPSGATTVGARAGWQRLSPAVSAYGRTPVLDVVEGQGIYYRGVEQAVFTGLNAEVRILSAGAEATHRTPSSAWSWRLGIGAMDIGGHADTSFDPQTMYFEAQPEQHRWSWHRLRLLHVDVGAVRQLTSQISVGYSVRQYVPLSGEWERDGTLRDSPGGVSGLSIGSMHSLRASMKL